MISVIYEDTEDSEFGILSIERLRLIEEFEKSITSHENWTSLCLASIFSTDCLEPDLAKAETFGALQSPLEIFKELDLQEATQDDVNRVFEESYATMGGLLMIM